MKVVNTFDTEYSGSIYSYVADPGLLVLQIPINTSSGESFNYKFLKTNYIKNIEILPKKIDDSKVVKISKIETNQIPKIIERNTKNVEISRLTRNENTTSEGQKVFNAVYKTVPNVKWKGNSIIILDEVIIENPYTVNSIKSIKSDEESDAIVLVKKIVDGIWTKIENNKKGG